MKFALNLLFVLGVFSVFGQTSRIEIRKQLDTIVNREGFRMYEDTATLNAVGVYIENEFKRRIIILEEDSNF